MPTTIGRGGASGGERSANFGSKGESQAKAEADTERLRRQIKESEPAAELECLRSLEVLCAGTCNFPVLNIFVHKNSHRHGYT